MAADNQTPEPRKPIRASRWKPLPSTPATSNRALFRLIGIPALAVAGVLIYRGVQERFTLPDCDSARAKSTLTNVLNEMRVGPVTDAAINTISTDNKQVVCNLLLPMSNGGSVDVDYRFFWQGNKPTMKYSISLKPPQGAPAPVSPPPTNDNQGAAGAR
jgi:hypothetical protein